jgi:hypothetical protein
MKQAVAFVAFMLALGPAANAVEFNKDALKSMQEEGHKIVEESKGARAYEAAGGHCLDMKRDGLVIKKCDAKAKTQMWKFDGKGRLVANDGRCVTGAKLQKCADSKAGKWKLDDKKRLANGAKQCLQVQGKPPKPGAQVVAAACSKSPNQVWN